MEGRDEMGDVVQIRRDALRERDREIERKTLQQSRTEFVIKLERNI